MSSEVEQLEKRLNANVALDTIKVKEAWVDPHFPHDASVVKNIPGVHHWARASEIFKGREKVYDSFSGDDIEQGNAGDCYLLSSISALAEFPGRVQKLFIQRDRNPAGFYVVKLYVCGQPVTVVVDDYMPVTNTNQPAFAGSKGQELWVMLIEKAWAKIHGTYTAIEGGDSRESLAAITCAPVDYLPHKECGSIDKLWRKISKYDKNNYVMCTGAKVEAKGIVPGHAYTLVGAFEFEDAKKEKVRLVQIRNPWGCTEWTGEWSDKDPRWTKELNAKLGHSNKDDGTFFMPFKDFYEIYFHSFVAKVHDDYIFSHKSFKNKSACAAFAITAETKGFVSVYQVTKRLGSTLLGKYNTEKLRAELYRMESTGPKLIKKVFSNAVGAAHIKVKLEPGQYVVSANFEAAVAQIPYLNIVAYTSKYVDLAPLEIEEGNRATAEIVQKGLSQLKSLYTQKAKSKGEAGAFHTCPAGHDMKWSSGPAETGDNYTCDNCRQPNKASDGRWLCQVCFYDVCSKCRPREYASISVSSESAGKPTCNKGHDMNFGASEDKSSLYLCCKCGKAYFGSVARWKCDECQTNLCRKCMNPPADYPKDEVVPEIDTCAQGHLLKYIVEETQNGNYECDICGKVGRAANGRWACRECSCNVCSICKPHEGAKKGGVSAKTKIVVCAKGHMLYYTSYPPPHGTSLQCDKCKKPIEKDNWRWNCKECSFDVCKKCRKPPHGRQDFTCREMHQLTFSNLPQGSATYGRCDLCRKTFELTKGRYCCLLCKYECCNKCVPITEVPETDVSEHGAPPEHKEGEAQKEDKHDRCDCCSIL